MTAVMSFIWCPFGSLYRGSDADVSSGRPTCVSRVKHQVACYSYVSWAAALTQDRVDEGVGVEGGQIVRALAEADELDRNAQLTLDRDDDAALGRAVQLGQHDAGDVDHLGEHPGLAEAVLPGGGVEH